MPAGRVTDRQLLTAAGVLTVLFAGAAAFIEGPATAAGGGASSLSTAATGGKAAYVTLAQLGYQIERSYEPMTAVKADPPQTTMIVTGPVRPSDQDRRALREFLERGGTVLLVGSQGAEFLGLEGAADPDPFATPVMHRVLVPSPLAVDARDITMVPAAAVPKFGPSYVAVFATTGDEPLVATTRVGSGRVVWWASPTPVANAHISGAGNLNLLLNIAGTPGEKLVLWDEHYHGHSRSLWSYAANTPLPWIAAHLGIAAIAMFAGYSRRRGPVRAKVIDARTSPLEFIDMLGALYKRARTDGAAVAAARSRLRRVTASACGIPVDSPDEVIARAAASKSGMDPAEITDLLATADRAGRDPGLSPAGALKVIQRLQRVTAAQQRLATANSQPPRSR